MDKHMTIKEIQSIIKDFESSPLMTLELEMGDFKLKLSKNKHEQLSSSKEIKENFSSDSKFHDLVKKSDMLEKMIKSPLVGTFYASTSPQGKPMVEVGDRIKKGQVVCIIEAMKIMNEITSPYEGIVKEIFIQNAEVVGYDEPIIRVGDLNEK